MSFFIIALWWAILSICQYCDTGNKAAFVLCIFFIGIASIMWAKHCCDFKALERKVEKLELNQPPKEVTKNEQQQPDTM